MFVKGYLGGGGPVALLWVRPLPTQSRHVCLWAEHLGGDLIWSPSHPLES
jgi:hypothetical protein